MQDTGMRAKTYPSDLSDAEWELVAPLLPPPKSGPLTGGRPAWDRRPIVDAILYLARTGCSWRQLPVDFPPWKTVYSYFAAWAADGTLDNVHDALRRQVRAAEGRDSEPTAAIVDSQSVKGADTVGKPSRGYDAGKKINGRKRHIVTDTLGLLLLVMVTPASVADRDGGCQLIWRLRRAFPGVRLVWADGGYAGKLVVWALEVLGIVVEIVRKKEGQRGFEVLPRRWVVERTFGWLVKWRRLCRDYERTTEHAEAMVKWVMIGVMTRRLGRSKARPRQLAQAA